MRATEKSGFRSGYSLIFHAPEMEETCIHAPSVRSLHINAALQQDRALPTWTRVWAKVIKIYRLVSSLVEVKKSLGQQSITTSRLNIAFGRS